MYKTAVFLKEDSIPNLYHMREYKNIYLKITLNLMSQFKFLLSPI